MKKISFFAIVQPQRHEDYNIRNLQTQSITPLQADGMLKI